MARNDKQKEKNSDVAGNKGKRGKGASDPSKKPHCNKCKKEFSSKGNLRRHVNLMHKQPQQNNDDSPQLANLPVLPGADTLVMMMQPLTCFMCGTVVANVFALAAHYTTHANDVGQNDPQEENDAARVVDSEMPDPTDRPSEPRSMAGTEMGTQTTKEEARVNDRQEQDSQTDEDAQITLASILAPTFQTEHWKAYHEAFLHVSCVVLNIKFAWQAQRFIVHIVGSIGLANLKGYAQMEDLNFEDLFKAYENSRANPSASHAAMNGDQRCQIQKVLVMASVIARNVKCPTEMKRLTDILSSLTVSTGLREVNVKCEVLE